MQRDEELMERDEDEKRLICYRVRVRARGSHPLFHAIVSMGAVLSSSSCGGVQTDSTGSTDTSRGGATSNGGGGGTATSESGGSGTSASGGSGTSASGGKATSESGGSGSGSAGSPGQVRKVFPGDGGTCPPGTVYDCAVANGCVCRGNVTVDECGDPAQFKCNLDPSDCWCDPDAPLAPGDCDNTAQFTCDQMSPLQQGCHCDLGAPLDQSACPPCAAFSCYSYSPPVGCHCVICIR
jgi:hypothetical protein